MSWTCENVRLVSEAFTTVEDADINNMNNTEFIDCLADIGSLTSWSAAQKTLLLSKTESVSQEAYCSPPFRRKAEGHSFWLSVCPSVCPSVLPSVLPSPYSSMYFVCNSFYSFILILLKLHRCFHHGLKICMWFGYNPQINFSHFFRNLNLVIFQVF